MQLQDFKSCLAEVYQGEVVGESAFDNMLGVVENREQRYIVASLLQFETEAKAIMRPVLYQYELPVHDAAQGYATGQAASDDLNQLPWKDRFEALQNLIASQYLPRYEMLETLVDPSQNKQAAEVARFMAEHERRILKVMENVVRGVDSPAEPIVQFISHPLPKFE